MTGHPIDTQSTRAHTRTLTPAYFTLLGAGALAGFIVLPFVAAFGTEGMIRWLAQMPLHRGLSWFAVASLP